MRLYLCSAILLFVSLGDATSSTLEETKEQALLDFVRTAHKATRESIRTLSCKVSFRITVERGSDPVTQTCSSEYWYSMDAVRTRIQEGETNLDYLWKDGIRKELSQRPENGKSVTSASRSAFESKFIHRCDALVRGLLALNVPGNITYLRANAS